MNADALNHLRTITAVANELCHGIVDLGVAVEFCDMVAVDALAAVDSDLPLLVELREARVALAGRLCQSIDMLDTAIRGRLNGRGG